MSDSVEPRGEYEIGYGKPPPEHKFKPGRSGNPNGRPSIDKRLESKTLTKFTKMLLAEARKKVIISENGKTLNLSKQKLLARLLVNKGLKGSLKDALLLAEAIKAAEIEEQEGTSDNTVRIVVSGGLPPEYSRFRRIQGAAKDRSSR